MIHFIPMDDVDGPEAEATAADSEAAAAVLAAEAEEAARLRAMVELDAELDAGGAASGGGGSEADGRVTLRRHVPRPLLTSGQTLCVTATYGPAESLHREVELSRLGALLGGIWRQAGLPVGDAALPTVMGLTPLGPPGSLGGSAGSGAAALLGLTLSPPEARTLAEVLGVREAELDDEDPSRRSGNAAAGRSGSAGRLRRGSAAAKGRGRSAELASVSDFALTSYDGGAASARGQSADSGSDSSGIDGDSDSDGAGGDAARRGAAGGGGGGRARRLSPRPTGGITASMALPSPPRAPGAALPAELAAGRGAGTSGLWGYGKRGLVRWLAATLLERIGQPAAGRGSHTDDVARGAARGASRAGRAGGRISSSAGGDDSDGSDSDGADVGPASGGSPALRGGAAAAAGAAASADAASASAAAAAAGAAGGTSIGDALVEVSSNLASSLAAVLATTYVLAMGSRQPCDLAVTPAGVMVLVGMGAAKGFAGADPCLMAPNGHVLLHRILGHRAVARGDVHRSRSRSSGGSGSDGSSGSDSSDSSGSSDGGSDGEGVDHDISDGALDDVSDEDEVATALLGHAAAAAAAAGRRRGRSRRLRRRRRRRTPRFASARLCAELLEACAQGSASRTGPPGVSGVLAAAADALIAVRRRLDEVEAAMALHGSTPWELVSLRARMMVGCSEEAAADRFAEVLAVMLHLRRRSRAKPRPHQRHQPRPTPVGAAGTYVASSAKERALGGGQRATGEPQGAAAGVAGGAVAGPGGGLPAVPGQGMRGYAALPHPGRSGADQRAVTPPRLPSRRPAAAGSAPAREGTVADAGLLSRIREIRESQLELERSQERLRRSQAEASLSRRPLDGLGLQSGYSSPTGSAAGPRRVSTRVRGSRGAGDLQGANAAGERHAAPRMR